VTQFPVGSDAGIQAVPEALATELFSFNPAAGPHIHTGHPGVTAHHSVLPEANVPAWENPGQQNDVMKLKPEGLQDAQRNETNYGYYGALKFGVGVLGSLALALAGSYGYATARSYLKSGQGRSRPVVASAASSPASLQGYGDHLFKGAVADTYLAKFGVEKGAIEKGEWIRDKDQADKVALAVAAWATDRGASVFCHWFQPQGSSGVRHGMSAQVQNAFFSFDANGQPVWDLKGKDLLQGETDGSSYNNGGQRATHTAGGYLIIDPTSPIFLRGDTIFVPAGLVSWKGDSLCEKIPLMKSVEALNEHGSRLLSLLGYKVDGLQSNIGLEQEFFLIPRSAYRKRPDLQLCGRTVTGKDAPRGQEMCDHYMGPPSEGSNPALACMKELQEECYKMGIPLKTRHREVAPNQYEHAPFFGTVTTQIDQNLMVMQMLEEVATRHGLAALLQEKPFNNINGSGKHNNWSIGTIDGVNLLNVDQLAKASGSTEIFPVIMSALVKALDQHGDLLRMAIASPGNDFRLGACEAPPAIVSTYLGQDMTTYLDGYRNGTNAAYKPQVSSLDTGVRSLNEVQIPSEDRNRTSPFPFGGHRFEFRAVGSSQNVSLVNTVLNTLSANAFKEFADAIEGGKSPQEVASQALNEHWKVIFNGDNYDPKNQQQLTDAGVWRIDSGIDAIARLSATKNKELFSKMGVLTAGECEARQSVLIEHYIGTVEIEAKCMIDMLNQHIIPSVKRAEIGPLEELQKSVTILEKALIDIHATADEVSKGTLARKLRLETMVDVREHVDAAEAVVPADLWTLATYSELLFLDQTE
jgi:glutamine synthetase